MSRDFALELCRLVASALTLLHRIAD